MRVDNSDVINREYKVCEIWGRNKGYESSPSVIRKSQEYVYGTWQHRHDMKTKKLQKWLAEVDKIIW